MRKKIILAGSNTWNAKTKVGTHHLAEAFRDLGWQVLYISDPLSLLHFAKILSSEQRARLRLAAQGLIEVDRDIWNLIPFGIVVPANVRGLDSTNLISHWHRFTIPNVSKQLFENGWNDVDLLYLDSPVNHFLLNACRFKKSVYRMPDLMKGFSKTYQSRVDKEIEICAKVNLLAYTGKSIRNYIDINIRQSNLMYLKNGVNLEAFKSITSCAPADLMPIPRPRVIYVGAIEEWLDYELVIDCAKKLPNASFVFIGNKSVHTKKFRGLANIYCLGAKPHRELAAYLSNSDLGLVPFNLRSNFEFVNAINPLKVLEYIATGLPIVSERWAELDQYSGFIRFSHRDSFADTIRDVIMNKPLMPDKFKIDTFLAEYTWKSRAEKLLSEIGLV